MNPLATFLRALTMAFGLVIPSAAAPSADAALCEIAARAAARETGVPLPILMAIVRAESGRAFSGAPEAGVVPWPWTLNSGGTGEWLASRQAALDRIEELHAAGQESIDIGCFQINLHWHGDAFRSFAEMLDPSANARHAAGFLVDLFRETGDWRAAAARFHSRDPRRAESYVRRLEAIHATATSTVQESWPPDSSVSFGLVHARGALLTSARGPIVGGP